MGLSGDRLAELRRVASAADDDGREWTWKASEREGSGGYPQQVLRVGDVVLVAECYESPDFPSRFAEFIAAFDPPTALALLDGLQGGADGVK
jgi:hypothetical protein